MSVRGLSLVSLLVGVWTSTLYGQVVQLPTFHYFSVSTSVLVPDRGGAYLGGIRRSADRRAVYGLAGAGRLFGNRAIDQSRGAGGVSAHVTIIDHDALDRATLAEAARRRAARTGAGRNVAPSVRVLASRSGDASDSSGDQLLSVAEIRRRNSALKAARVKAAVRFFEQGREAAAQGKLGVAKIYYRMAQRRAEPTLRREIAKHLKALEVQPRTRSGSHRIP